MKRYHYQDVSGFKERKLTHPVLRVAFFPSANSPAEAINPYLSLLRNALRKYGVEVDSSGGDIISWSWLLRKRCEIQVLHLHWLHFHYHTGSLGQTLFRFFGFMLKLVFARSLGYRLVWTMHNISPHESRYPLLDYIGQLMVTALLANAITVHCEVAREELRRKFLRHRSVYTAPHGHYASVYPPAMARADARIRLGFDDRCFIFLYFGLIRSYKGIELLADEFVALDKAETRLIIVGPPRDTEVLNNIRLMCLGNSRVYIRAEFILPEELATYIGAADVVVLPFRRIFTSGSAILAMSLGRPVIAPTLGCLPELILPGTGILYDPTEPSGLRKALLCALRSDLCEMGRLAYDRAMEFTWDRSASAVIEAYRDAAKWLGTLCP